jgi:CheY-like chemotaxis protein
MNEPDRRSIEDILSERVRLAAESYREKKENAARVREAHKDGLTPAPDGTLAALRAERVAQAAYSRALAEFSSFLLEGKVPEIDENHSLAPVEAVSLPIREPGKAARVLVVDDEPGVRQFVQAALSGAGYEVHTAVDGSEAIAICHIDWFDLIVSDVVMPGMNGHELAQWIAKNRPNTRMVLMTGYDGTNQENPQPASFHFLIRKPFQANGLLTLVNRVLLGERKERE